MKRVLDAFSDRFVRAKATESQVVGDPGLIGYCRSSASFWGSWSHCLNPKSPSRTTHHIVVGHLVGLSLR